MFKNMNSRSDFENIEEMLYIGMFILFSGIWYCAGLGVALCIVGIGTLLLNLGKAFFLYLDSDL